MTEVLEVVLSVAFWSQAVRITMPYALTAVGGSVCERAGVIDIALEGKLLLGAFCAAACAHATGSLALAVLAGIAGGAATAALYGLVVLVFRADQIVSGVAINLLAYGLTRYLLQLAYGSSANSPTTVGLEAGVLGNWVAWLAVATMGLVYLTVARTPIGLRLRAVGDHPVAARSVGVAVSKIRWLAVLVAGALAGLGGGWLALSNAGFVAEMSGGRGYIALAAVIMGSWRPQWAIVACCFFGLAETVQLNLQAAGTGLPDELVGVLPYVLTMVALAGFIGRSRPPAALGQP